MSRICLMTAGIVFATAFSLSACENAKRDTRPPEKIWSETCATCHGKDGRGLSIKLGRDTKVKMNMQVWQDSITDDEIIKTIKEGKAKNGKRMPAYGKKLSDEQLNGLLDIVRSRALE